MNDRWPAAAQLQQLVSAMLDGRLGDAQIVELRRLLRDDPEARRQYVRQITAHAMLQWINAPLGIGLDADREARDEEPARQPRQSESGLPICAPPPQAAPSWFSPFHVSSLSVPALAAYSLAVLMSAALLLGFGRLQSASTSVPLAGTAPLESVSPSPAVDEKFVGRITGMVGCRWTDPVAGEPNLAPVPLGRTYALAAGLLEIRYRSGAKVILQGPCTYCVESDHSGFLSSGKLTATVEKKGEGRGEKGSDRNTGVVHSPLALHPSPFVLRTPIAVVLGDAGQFGVHVEGPRVTRTYLFRGQATLRFGSGGGMEPEERLLGENDYARVEELGHSVAATVMQNVICPDAFVRSLPKQGPAETCATQLAPPSIVGKDRTLGFQPARAVPLDAGSLVQQGAGKPWSIKSVALTGADPRAATGATHTVHVTFELTESIDLDSAELVGQYVTDNLVKAMRFNGKVLRGPSRTTETRAQRKGIVHLWGDFRRGTNLLEIDVEQINSTGSPEDKLLDLRMEIHADRKSPASSSPPPAAAKRPSKQADPPAAKGGYFHEVT